MATTLGSTGVTFPDSTTQTTAITANPATSNVRQAVTSAATTTIDLSLGSTIDLTMAANITTMSFTNVSTSGKAMQINFVIKNNTGGNVYTITWPSSVYWNSATVAAHQTAPTLATGKFGLTVIALLTTDGGTKWRGWVVSSIPGEAQNRLYTWGTHEYGRTGLSLTSGIASSPQQVGALTNWAAVAAEPAATAALKTDGTLWAFGANPYSVLGIGPQQGDPQSSPGQVGSDTNWVKHSTGSNAGSQIHILAINSSGELYGTGANDFGQLADGSTTRRGSLVRAFNSGPVAGTSWADVEGGGRNSWAISTTGQLWSSGRNYNGSLGLNNTSNYSQAKQVGTLTNWSKLARINQTFGAGNRQMGAIKTDGTLWMWGSNSSGQLGLNNTTNYSSPKQVGTLTSWAQLSISEDCSMAIKTDGTLWAWGANNGRFGNSSNVSTSSPVQVGTFTNWNQVRHNGLGGLATKTDGTLWGWGDNNSGQLGLSNLTSPISSPVQIGSRTDWLTSAEALSAVLGGGAALTTTSLNPQ